MSDDLIRDIEAATKRDHFRADIEARGREAFEKVKDNAKDYLTAEGVAKLEEAHAKLVKAHADLELMIEPSHIAAQREIIESRSAALKLCMDRARIREEFAVITARNIVMAFVRDSLKELAGALSEVAVKHGLRAVRERFL